MEVPTQLAGANVPPGVSAPRPMAQFVERLVSQTGRTDLSSHPKVVEAALSQSQAEASRLFMEAIMEVPVKPTRPAPPGVMASIASREATRRAEHFQELKLDEEELMSNVDYQIRIVHDSMAKLQRHRAEAALFTGVKQGANLADELVKAQEWYELDESAVNKIVLRTPTVFISHFNSAAGINETVNLGRYEVHVPLDLSCINVYRLSDNVMAGSNYHPHVSSSGHPCWGNGNVTVRDALLEGKLSTALEVLRSLLCTYNDAGPYVPLDRFVSERQPIEWEGMPLEYVPYGLTHNQYSKAWYSSYVLIPHTLLPKSRTWASLFSSTRTFTIGGVCKRCKGYFVPVYKIVYSHNGVEPHSKKGRYYVQLEDGTYYEVPREYNMASAPCRTFMINYTPKEKEQSNEQEEAI